jgi:NaMN:DMB phosphoribosyltransferase
MFMKRSEQGVCQVALMISEMVPIAAGSCLALLRALKWCPFDAGPGRSLEHKAIWRVVMEVKVGEFGFLVATQWGMYRHQWGRFFWWY